MAQKPPRILFAPAAGAEIGGGHVMRDLALAEALAGRGAFCVFAVPSWGAQLLARFADVSFPVIGLSGSGEPAAIASALQAAQADVLVLDDYPLDARAVAPLVRPGLRIVVIDDLCDRSYACDLLVDPGYGREAADYDGRTPPACEVLAGPRYALLRNAFANVVVQPAPPTTSNVQRVFVSFGLSDVDMIAARAVERLRPRAPSARFDVALASDAPSLVRLQAMAAADPGLRLHPDARDVATLMRAADVAVGAGGSATWERCALGLPTLAVVVADNQRQVIGRLAEAGAVLAVNAADGGVGPALDAAFDRLCEPQVRAALRAASQSLCDGRGAGRVADAILRLVERSRDG